MRVLAAVLTVTLAACSPTPSPSPQAQPRAATSTAPASSPSPGTTPEPTESPGASRTIFSFDVENRASVGVIVAVASDAAAVLPGFEPGERGTVSIGLQDPTSGIGVEIQGVGCRLLASATYPTPGGFTLVVEDGAGTGTVRLSTRLGMAAVPIRSPRTRSPAAAGSRGDPGCGG